MRDITRTLGLDGCPPFHRDGLFLTALLAAGGFWLLLWCFVPVWPMAVRQVLSWNFLALTIWQPCLEELVFRGFLQGQLHRQAWGQRTWRGITVANVTASLLFMVGHWWHHPLHWAIAVMIPSLMFGYFRDRYASVYPAVVLHAFYNTGYFLLTGFPQ